MRRGWPRPTCATRSTATVDIAAWGNVLSKEEALRAKLAELETSALLAMWKEQERLPWADEVLRDELVGRGVSPASLQGTAAARDSRTKSGDISTRETIVSFGLIGRMLAIFGALVASRILGGLVGGKAGGLGAMAVLLAYALLLANRLLQHSGRSEDARSRLGITYLWVEVAFLLLLVAAGTLSVLWPRA